MSQGSPPPTTVAKAVAKGRWVMMGEGRAGALTCLLRACWAGALRKSCWLLQDPAALLEASLLPEASVLLGAFLQCQTPLGNGDSAWANSTPDLATPRLSDASAHRSMIHGVAPLS